MADKCRTKINRETKSHKETHIKMGDAEIAGLDVANFQTGPTMSSPAISVALLKCK